jgi:hypothetical protein
VSSNAVEDPLVGIVASLEVLDPAEISVTPESLYQELYAGQTASQTLTISNNGASPLEFSFEGVAMAGVPSVAKEPIESSDGRSSQATQTINLKDAAAITNPAAKMAGAEQYATSFEEFAPGNINGQQGWVGQFGNWRVEGINPFTGVQHFRGLSDGFGLSIAFSPLVPIGTDPVSSTTMKVNIAGSGTTWQIVPQSPTAGFVTTRFQINADRSLSVLASDSLGNASYVTIPGSWPSGYVNFRLDVQRATSIFTIYINDSPVFTGLGFSGDIEQVVILSLMEEAGQTLDLDNLAILDGAPSAPWLMVTPLSGVVPGGGSATVTVHFNAGELGEGTYSDTLQIASNDPVSSVVPVPVTLVVDENKPPVLIETPDLTVLEKDLILVTFRATDEDDSLVQVNLQYPPSFISYVYGDYHSATYRINPPLGSEGEYDLVVRANDLHGATDYDTVHLSVVKFAVQSFSVVNKVTGEVISEFTDAITLNRADPGFSNLNIRANPTPAVVGSVKFKINGSQKNIDSSSPYLLKSGLLSGLGVGDYTLLAEPFTQANGHGYRGVGKTAVITIINETTVVTDFSLVNTSTGEVILNFSDSVAINPSDPNFSNMNIRANTSPAVVGSVKFKVDGSQKNIDNTNPYLLKSLVLQGLTGTHSLLAEPFELSGGHGDRGLGKTAVITMVTSSGAALSARQGAGSDGAEELQELRLYPSPASDHLNVSLSGKAESNVEITIMNIHGQVIHRVRLAEKVMDHTINLNELRMSSGVYYFTLQRANGKRELKRFIKQ